MNSNITLAQNGFTISDIFNKEVAHIKPGSVPSIPSLLVDGKCPKDGLEYKNVHTSGGWKWVHICPFCKSLVSLGIKDTDINGKEIQGHNANLRVSFTLEDGITEVSMTRMEFSAQWDALRTVLNPNWKKSGNVYRKIQKAQNDKFGGSKKANADGAFNEVHLQQALDHFGKCEPVPAPEWVKVTKKPRWIDNPNFGQTVNGVVDLNQHIQTKYKVFMKNTKTGERLSIPKYKVLMANLELQGK